MFVKQEGKVLLIRKKRGFGKGKINGPGGKLDEGETPLQAAVRETEEELGITPLDPEYRGSLAFEFTDGMRMFVSVFMATQYSGEEIETEEAAPLWFEVEKIPFEQMWADDQHWLGRMLETKENFEGKFEFEGDQMLWHEVRWDSDVIFGVL